MAEQKRLDMSGLGLPNAEYDGEHPADDAEFVEEMRVLVAEGRRVHQVMIERGRGVGGLDEPDLQIDMRFDDVFDNGWHDYNDGDESPLERLVRLASAGVGRRPLDVDLIRQAINDPGRFTPRLRNLGPEHDERETIGSWGARAVVKALEGLS